MSVPKQRHTKTRRDRKRKKLFNLIQTVNCGKCQSPTMPHTVCGKCGYYQDREVVNTFKKKKKKKEKK